MNIRRLQGYALIASAFLGIVTAFGSDTSLLGTLAVLSTLFFIIGIPAVYTSQPIGTAGLVGVILMIVAAVIALGFRLLNIDLDPTLINLLIWTSVIAGFVGRVIVGWLTVRHDVFPAWIGWALIVEGVLNFASGLLNIDSLSTFFSIAISLVGSAALFGYGYYLTRKQTAVATV